MLNKFLLLFERIEKIGLTKEAEARLGDEYIRSSNRISIINFFLIFQASLFVYYTLPESPVYLIVFFIGWINLLSIPLNYFGYFRMAKISPWFFSILGVLICSSILGVESQVHTLIPIIVFGAILAHTNESILIYWLLMAMVVTVGFILIITDFSLLRDDTINLIQKNKLAGNVFFINIFSTIISVVFYFRKIQTKQRLIEEARNETEKKYEELSQAHNELDNLVYSVSHDLRAPIATTLGIIHLCIEEENKDTVTTYLKLGEQSLNKLDKFIYDVLVYSKNTRMEVEYKHTSLETVVEEALSLQLNTGALPEVSVIKEIEETIPFYGDRQRLFFVVNNLISNAIRYRKKVGPTEIRISVITSAENLIIKIKDNGQGIEESVLPRIFDMFFRANTHSQGSGLGLYIVRETLKKLNGTISVTSQLNKGTEFIVKVPNYHNGHYHETVNSGYRVGNN